MNLFCISDEELAADRAALSPTDRAALDALPITFEQWEEKYQPVANILNQDAPFDGLMFETYGAEFDRVRFVLNAFPDMVWTIVEGDNEHRYLCAGFHLVNRVGYFLTAKPWSAVNPPHDIDIDADSEVDDQ
jgi:hypothetical protein